MLETEIQELEECAEIIHNELEWSTMVGSRMDVDENTKHLDEVDKLVVSKTEILAGKNIRLGRLAMSEFSGSYIKKYGS